MQLGFEPGIVELKGTLNPHKRDQRSKTVEMCCEYEICIFCVAKERTDRRVIALYNWRGHSRYVKEEILGDTLTLRK